MIRKRIEREVAQVAARYRRLWCRTALSMTFLVAAFLGIALLAARWLWGWHSPWSAPALLALAGLAALACFALGRRIAGDALGTARRIEARHPELDSRLLAALEQEPGLPGGRLGYLQETLLQEVLAHARHSPWRETVPARKLRLAGLASFAAFSALIAALAAIVSLEPRRPDGRLGSPGAAGNDRYVVSVDPGDAEVERGASLLVLARFEQAVPPSSSIWIRNEAGEERRHGMSKSLDDPVFGFRFDEVKEDLAYRVEFAGEMSPTYRITVFELPGLTRADAKLVYPEHTLLEPVTLVDTRRVSAVEGSELTWILHLNVPVERAWLSAADGGVHDLMGPAARSPSTGASRQAAEEPAGKTPEFDGDPRVLTFSTKLATSSRSRLHLVDAKGRENREPPTLVVTVVRNQRPQLTFSSPKGDVRVSPIEELTVAAKVRDDFGLRRYGLSYALAGRPPQDLSLGEDVPGKDPREVRHLIDFEALGAEQDQVLSFYLWAEDAGTDGRQRRTFSDMYFAEVRPFEEIFRQGQDRPGGEEELRDPERQGEGEQQGEGQDAGDAEDLAELQKQILSGTWKLIRQAEEGGADGDAYAKDGAVLVDSQQSALDRTGSLEEGLEDAEAKSEVEAVRGHMRTAVEKLTEAVESRNPDALRPALTAEQAAYQALLKLRAREYLVARAQGQGQQRGAARRGGRIQRQLDQLQLSSSRNRYEGQRTAPRDSSQGQARQEDRQALNRLRELARRQGDVNQEVKDLQSALAEAREQQEREELLKRLKRLRDAEQQILRDTDELAERMGQPENADRLAGAREQLRSTREDVRRASEALEEGRVSTAAAAGTRAEREMRELSDELRQRAAGQFTEEMRQMRSDAEELERNEEEIGGRLAGLNDSRDTSLRGGGERDQVRDGLEKQRRELEGLLQRMQETVEEAEKPEPLLAEKLYDTLRRTRQSRTEESLDITRRLLERGFVDDAGRVEETAREGLRELRRGVEGAAESVLGDEAEALRRARGELERLSDEVEREIARAGAGQSPSRGAEGEDVREPPAGRGERERASGEDVTETARAVSGDPGRARDTRPAGDGEGSPEPSDRAEAEAPRTGPGGPERRPRSLRGEGDPNERGGSGPTVATRDDPARDLAPIAGDDFRDWSERLRDVEEMIDDPALRAEAARIRDQARGLRSEIKRHSKEPNWDLIRMSVAEPLKALGRRIGDELLRRESRDSLVPIDSDPVPPEYSERVREYYERLGSGK